MTNRMLLKNACYFANGCFNTGDILVNEGVIAAIGAPGEIKTEADIPVLDTSGLTVLPGIVDSHVHFRDPGRPDREDFFTGSRAAAAGGVTTFCEMPLACPPPNSLPNLQNRIDLGERRCVTDFALLGAAGYDNRHVFQDLLDAGVIAFKTFLHPAPAGREAEFDGLTVGDDGELFMMMQAGAATDGRFYFHCENARLIAALEQELHEQGRDGFDFHYRSRSELAETQSVEVILRFARATGCKVGIVHISAPEACELVRKAQHEGVDVVAETCFHYLCYDHSHIDKFGPYAKCNPPLRCKESVDKLWEYIYNGTVTYIGSDHAPFIESEKEIGVKEGIWRAYSGMPAVEMLLPLMLQQANKGRLTLEQLIPLLTENTAKVYGIYPQKGHIAVGADADFTVVDMEQEYTVRIADMQSKARAINKLFDGETVKGRPVYTIVRGRVIMDHGVIDDSAEGYGRYVARIKR